MKLKQYLGLTEGTDFGAPEQIKYTPQDKRAFLEACKQFGSHGASIYRAQDLKERVDQIRSLIETAEKMTLQETSEMGFDAITVNRHMKQLKESYKIFEKTSSEIMGAQQRLEAAYEDIGSILGKYYEV